MRIWQEEVFGPFITVAPFAKEAEAVAIANGVPYGLGAGLWTQNLRRAHGVAAQLRAGVAGSHPYQLVHPPPPFGGAELNRRWRDRGFATIRQGTPAERVLGGRDLQAPRGC